MVEYYDIEYGRVVPTFKRVSPFFVLETRFTNISTRLVTQFTGVKEGGLFVTWIEDPEKVGMSILDRCHDDLIPEAILHHDELRNEIKENIALSGATDIEPLERYAHRMIEGHTEVGIVKVEFKGRVLER